MSAVEELVFGYSHENGKHTWSVVGPLGGVHIWASVAPEIPGFYREERFYGGIEVHWRNPHYDGWHDPEKPHHDDCWLTGGPCWHDGSSLYFSEHLEPMLRHAPEPFGEGIHEYMKAECLDWYRDKMRRDDE